MARALSHSSISMYRECPQKYKFKYVDKLPEKPKYFFSFGRSLHSALEFFYGAALPPGLDRVLAFYKEHWTSEGYKDAAQEAEYFADGERILKGFYGRHIADFKPPFFAEYRFDIKVDGVPVTGFVDRVDKAGADRIAIVDYKTGKAFDEERVSADAQLTLYQMACEELLGMKVDSLTFYHLNSLTPYTARPHSEVQVRGLRERIVTVARSIEEGRFDPTPGERVCAWCDFKPHCPVFRDQYAPMEGLFAAPPPISEPAPAPEEELAVLIDAYGRMLDEIASLEARAEEAARSVAAKLLEKGWVRAFGASYEASLAREEKWEFRDKAKVLDLIRKSGRWEDILAPSAPLVQKMLRDPTVPADLRQRLMELGERIEKSSIRLKKVEPTAA